MNKVQKIQKALEELSIRVQLASLTGEHEMVGYLMTVRSKLEGELFYAVNAPSNVIYVDFAKDAETIAMDLVA